MKRTIVAPHARWNPRACLRTYRARTDFAPADRLTMCWALFRHGEWTS